MPLPCQKYESDDMRQTRPRRIQARSRAVSVRQTGRASSSLPKVLPTSSTVKNTPPDQPKAMPEDIQDQTPPPALSKIHPNDIAEYTGLWYQAHSLADYVDGDAPYQDRVSRMPELNELAERMKELESRTGDQGHTDQAGHNGRGKKISGIPEDYIQAPAVWNHRQPNRETRTPAGPAKEITGGARTNPIPSGYAAGAIHRPGGWM